MIIPIVFTFDKSLTNPAVVCLTSLLENANKETYYDIFILHSSSISFEDTPLIKLQGKYSNCRITFRSIINEFVGAYEIRGIPETAYYRLLIPEIIPEYEKVLYSDVDVIFREDLSKYYSIDIEGYYFGAVDNCSVLRPDVQAYVNDTLGLCYEDGYFYSGNLIINAKLQRDHDMMKKFRELAKNQYNQQDMDIINIACNKQILRVSPSYCMTNFLYDLMVNRKNEMISIYGEETVLDALENGIVHYNGPKPWNTNCMNMDIWWDYYRRSIVFDETFAYSFYNKLVNIEDSYTLIKRVKLLIRFFLFKRK